MALDGVSGGSGVGGNEGGEMIGEDVKGVAEEFCFGHKDFCRNKDAKLL